MASKEDVVFDGSGRRAYGVSKFRKSENTLDSIEGIEIDPTAPVGSALVKEADGVFRAGATAGTGDMTKSVYDTDDDGRVEAADTLSDVTNTATAAEA